MRCWSKWCTPHVNKQVLTVRTKFMEPLQTFYAKVRGILMHIKVCHLSFLRKNRAFVLAASSANKTWREDSMSVQLTFQVIYSYLQQSHTTRWQPSQLLWLKDIATEKAVWSSCCCLQSTVISTAQIPSTKPYSSPAGGFRQNRLWKNNITRQDFLQDFHGLWKCCRTSWLSGRTGRPSLDSINPSKGTTDHAALMLVSSRYASCACRGDKSRLGQIRQSTISKCNCARKYMQHCLTECCGN